MAGSGTDLDEWQPSSFRPHSSVRERERDREKRVIRLVCDKYCTMKQRRHKNRKIKDRISVRFENMMIGRQQQQKADAELH